MKRSRQDDLENAASALERAASAEERALEHPLNSLSRTNLLLEAVTEKLTALGHVLLRIETDMPGG